MPNGVRSNAPCDDIEAKRTKELRRIMPVIAVDGSLRRNQYHIFRTTRSRNWLVGTSLIGAAFASLLFGPPESASAEPLSFSAFATLASRCASTVPAETLEAVARTESDLDPLALHDNTTGRNEEPENLALATAEGAQWVGRGDSVDIGLMQINASNLPALGMTIATSLDPCASLAGGAAVLQAAYGGGNTGAERQAALLMALSRYNTGSPLKGIMNGYVRTVLNNAGNEELPALTAQGQAAAFVDPDAPPSWNVSAEGAYVQTHGASWLIALAPLPRTTRSPAGETPSADPRQFAATYSANSSTPATTR